MLISQVSRQDLRISARAFSTTASFVLAVALIGDDDTIDGPHYIRNPFNREPGWGVASINFSLGDLLARAEVA